MQSLSQTRNAPAVAALAAWMAFATGCRTNNAPENTPPPPEAPTVTELAPAPHVPTLCERLDERAGRLLELMGNQDTIAARSGFPLVTDVLFKVGKEDIPHDLDKVRAELRAQGQEPSVELLARFWNSYAMLAAAAQNQNSNAQLASRARGTLGQHLGDAVNTDLANTELNELVASSNELLGDTKALAKELAEKGVATGTIVVEVQSPRLTPAKLRSQWQEVIELALQVSTDLQRNYLTVDLGTDDARAKLLESRAQHVDSTTEFPTQKCLEDIMLGRLLIQAAGERLMDERFVAHGVLTMANGLPAEMRSKQLLEACEGEVEKADTRLKLFREECAGAMRICTELDRRLRR